MAVEFAIRTENLTKQYKEVLALDHLNLEVPAGSIFGYLGRNGAGKTTTMRLLAGLAAPTSGRAWIDGIEITGGEETARRHFGYLPQEPAFYTWMTPVEYLDYAGRISGLPGRERKAQIQEVLSLAGLQAAAKRRIGGFSGGMKQRLGIAQALLGKPPVLLLDEPTSSLDAAGRYEMLEMVASLRGRVTVFFSSHILADVERVCDTIAILHDGRLVLVSERQALLESYPVNAVEIELETNQTSQKTEKLAAWISQVREQPWAAEVYQEGGKVRIMVSDLEQAKTEVLDLAARSKLRINRFEWVRPSLEEIFLKLSA